MNNNTPSHPLLIKTFTWEKDSNELIDYESSSLRTTSYTTQTEGAFYRYDNKVLFTNKDNNATTNDHCYLSAIKVNEGNYYYQSTQKNVFTSEFNRLDNLSWLVFKGKKYPSKNQKYLLTEGEILKIGRIWLYVREIHLNTSMNKKDNDDDNDESVSHNNNNNNGNDNDDTIEIKNKHSRTFIMKKLKTIKVLSNKTTIKTIRTPKHKKNFVCRICYIEEEDPLNNPLIRPCSCSGSMRYIHLLCLRQWLSSKILVKANTFSPIDFCTTYTITQIKCELCKERFPDTLVHYSKHYNLIDIKHKHMNDQGIDVDDESYIVFDTLSPDRNNNKYRYYVKFDGKYLRIGRGLEVQLMLGDISVSRIHCVLTIIGGNKVILEDFNSKFGTLVLIRNPSMQIVNDLPFTVQIGRSYLHMEIKQPFRLFSCCNANDNNNNLHYEIENKKHVTVDSDMYIKEEPEDIDDSEENDENDSTNSNIKKQSIRVIKENDSETPNNGVKPTNDRYNLVELNSNDINNINNRELLHMNDVATGRDGIIILNNNLSNPLKETKVKESNSQM
jgi:hypothetical protein